MDEAFSPLSEHALKDYSPPCILIRWLIFKIYRNALTTKVSGHLYDSNIKQC